MNRTFRRDCQLANGYRAVVVALMLTLTACGGESDSPQQGNSQQDAKPVQATKATAQPLEDRVTGIGELKSPGRVEIQPEVSALVRGVDFVEGARVQAGDTLFRLDGETLRKDLQAAQAQQESAQALLEEARQAFERQKELYEADVASDQRFEQAQAEIETARARVREQEARIASLEAQLEDFTISAPMSGVVTEIMVDPGDYVSAGESLVTLLRVDVLELTFSLPERAGSRVAEGQPITATIDAVAQKQFEGELVFVSPAVDRATRTFLVKAEIDNSDGLLKPGMFASAFVVVGMAEGNPVIPEESLVGSPGGYQVFTISDDNKVRLVDVDVGIRETGRVEITGGLEQSQRIVRSGVLGLAEEDKVEIEELQTNGENEQPERELDNSPGGSQ